MTQFIQQLAWSAVTKRRVIKQNILFLIDFYLIGMFSWVLFLCPDRGDLLMSALHVEFFWMNPRSRDAKTMKKR